MTIMTQKCLSRSTFTYIIFIISFTLTTQAEVKPFSDIEDFSRINSWTYKGLSWSGKIESDNQFNLTADPPSDDNDVILCFTRSKPSTLLKDFTIHGPLTKANFTIKYYVRVLDPSFNMKGLLFDSKDTSKSHTLFDYHHSDFDGENNTWIIITALHESDIVPDNFTANNFTVKLEFSSTSMIYDDDLHQYQFVAVDELSLTGLEAIISLPVAGNTTKAPVQPTIPATVPPPSPPVVNQTTAAPEVNTTSPVSAENTTTAPPEKNETLSNTTSGNNNNNATETPIEKTTVAGNNTNIIGPTDAQDGGLKDEVEKVAKAIWDAFYVFLALFCACLIALIILIYKARNSRDDAPPPAVATYNPRTASYRLDSTGSSQYDNAGYRNEAV